MTDQIERKLSRAQRAYLKAIADRRAAVVEAYQQREPSEGDDGKPKSIYRIAQILGVKESAIRSILKTAADLERKGEKA